MDNTVKSPTILSTVTGMRSLERGTERAFYRIGWQQPRTLAYVEIEAVAAWNLVKQMEQGVLDSAPVWTNLKTFKFQMLRGKVDLLTGGYPCQPFSLAGKQLGSKDPRHLWPFYETGIDAMRPVGCFFENVRQHLNNGYEEVKHSLEGLGYSVREGIYSAEEVGATHKRDRLFILALDNSYRDQQGSFSINIGKMFGIPKKECESKYSSIISTGTGNVLDNPIGQRLEGYAGDDCKEGREGSIRSIAQTSFPLGQGHNQHDWEGPRLKSRMGLTVNGYDFTEDLLRMAGNGVVEQTAELAFIDLLRKHGIHLTPPFR